MPILPDHKDVRDFISYLRLKNLSQRTIGEYQWVLHDFLRFCYPEIQAPHEVTFDNLRDYIAGLQARRLSSKTIGDRVKILKQFFGYLYIEERIPSDPAKMLPVPKAGMRLPKALTLEETKLFLAALSDNSGTGCRDRVLFHLMYAGGLRVGELRNLRVEDIDFEDGSLRVIGKGDRERRVYLKPGLLRMLREYIESEDIGKENLLFPGRGGKPLTVRNVQLRIKLYSKAAGITRRVTPHTLRHSIAVHYLQGGAPVNFVQSLLGHASLATTGRYLQLTDQMVKQIALKTQTALERSTSSQKEPKVREPYPSYQRDSEFELWDEYVTDVLEWL